MHKTETHLNFARCNVLYTSDTETSLVDDKLRNIVVLTHQSIV